MDARERLETFFLKGGELDKTLEGYEVRQGQLRLAKAVFEIVHDESGMTDCAKVLVAEAGTGIGKTLAYLLPAVLSGRKTIVSTATLNLQDQILGKDLPLLERALGRRVSAACLKGRQNYLCLYRYYQYRSTPQLSLTEDPRLQKLDFWLKRTITGEKSELEWFNDKDSLLWNKISATSSQCLGGECPEYHGCFLNNARRQAGGAQLLVVNHSLFFSDLAVRRSGFGEVLPRCETVIFDEAHHLEDIATQFFGISFGSYQLFDLLIDVERQLEEDGQTEAFIQREADLAMLRNFLDDFVALFPANPGAFALDTLIAEQPAAWQRTVDNLIEGLKCLKGLSESLESINEVWVGIGKRLDTLYNNLLLVTAMDPEEEGERVRWFERRKRSVQLYSTPVNVADEIRQHLFPRFRSVVLTSATLVVDGSFDYVVKQLGLPEETTFEQIGSPYDYSTKTLLYIPPEPFPEPREKQFRERAGEEIVGLLTASSGRGLVLCTSRSALEYYADYLATKIDFPLYVQGDGSRSSLLQKFRKETDSVLLALASFWEGVDISGETLSCVIIDKLPFEVPSDPVLKARTARIEARGGRPFFELQVPRAVLILRQGVGRLIRANTDCGVISILDTRILSKGYGKKFRHSLPPSPITRSLADVEQFFQKL